ncbi:MAG: hypothetical protein OXH22_06820 [Chloroflexi bacterium]|nr:hypothetical protein [Chloroflexota bacterium]
MGGLFVLGIVLTIMGLSVMSGLMQVLINLTGNLLIGGGIIAAVVGGVSMIFGGIASKVVGLGLLMLGIAVAVMGVIMRFILHLWFISWLIEFGGVVMLVIGIILAVVGLIGMLKGGDKKTRIRYGKGSYIEYY